MSGQTTNEILTPRPEHHRSPESTVEQPISAVEQTKDQEQSTEIPKEDSFLDDAITKIRSALGSSKRKPVLMPQVRDDITIKVEAIMASGLDEAYLALEPLQRQEFKLKGEQTAIEIRSLLQETKIKVKKIYELLIEWLKVLPGVNRFFLEQEAKIKADQIIALHKQNKHL